MITYFRRVTQAFLQDNFGFLALVDAMVACQAAESTAA
jgi:hypothetical protein